MDYNEEYQFTYVNSEGLQVSQDVDGETTYHDLVGKFVRFLQATGYDYLGAWHGKEGLVIGPNGGGITLDIPKVLSDDIIKEFYDKADAYKGPEDYWDEQVDKAASDLIEVGDRVLYTGEGYPDDHNGNHGGLTGVSLVGAEGIVTQVLPSLNKALVSWDDWKDGNGTNKDEWYVYLNNLVRID